MLLKLSLVRPSGESVDVVVTADATTTVGEVATRIAESKQSGTGWDGTDSARGFTLQVQGPAQGGYEVIAPRKILGETAIESGRTVALLAFDSNHPASVSNGPCSAELLVVQGHDRGNRYTVTEAGALLGRGTGIDVPLSDPLVSKRHARLEVEPGALTVIDLNSANGLLVDGITVPRATLAVGDLIGIGSSMLQVVNLTQPTAGQANEGLSHDAHAFTRSPRVEARFAGETHELPVPPAEEDPQPFPFLVMVAPLIIGVVLYLATGSILSVIFIGLSPIMIVGNYFSTRIARKAKLKRQIEIFDRRLDELDTKLAAEVEVERAVRVQESPSTFDVLHATERREQLLWTRRPEHWNFLNVYMGIGRSWSRTEIEKVRINERTLPEFENRAEEFIKRYETIDGVPIIEHVPIAGGIGVVSREQGGVDYTHGLMAQIVGLHSAGDLVVTALLNPASTVEFDWLKWLPHSTAAADILEVPPLANSGAAGQQLLAKLEELITARLAAKTSGQLSHYRPPIDREASVFGKAQKVGDKGQEPIEVPLPVVLVLVVDAVPVDRGRLIQLFERGAEAGVFPVWLTPELSLLPAVCRSYIEIG
ncbi:MAG: FHA domain-containing protein [Leucobacter sp.]|nr:FHA domain-containing protein [Leucobacter sp.]